MRLSPVAFSEVKDDWETPPELWASLNALYPFDLDVAACPENARIGNFISYPDEDALDIFWPDRGKFAYMNPPYSNWKPWAEKAFTMSAWMTIVGLLPVDTSTKAFHQYIYRNPNVEINFIPRRLRFFYQGLPGPHPARFASMLVVWRPPPEYLR